MSTAQDAPSPALSQPPLVKAQGLQGAGVLLALIALSAASLAIVWTTRSDLFSMQWVLWACALQGVLAVAFFIRRQQKQHLSAGFAIPLLVAPVMGLLLVSVGAFWEAAKVHKALGGVLPLYVSDVWYEALYRIEVPRAMGFIVAAVGFLMVMLCLVFPKAPTRLTKKSALLALAGFLALAGLFVLGVSAWVIALSALAHGFVIYIGISRGQDPFALVTAGVALLGVILCAALADLSLAKASLALSLVAERDLGAMSMGDGLILLEAFDKTRQHFWWLFALGTALMILLPVFFSTLTTGFKSRAWRAFPLLGLFVPLLLVNFALSQSYAATPARVNAAEESLLRLQLAKGGSRARPRHAPLIRYEDAHAFVDGYRHALAIFYPGKKQSLKNILDAAMAVHHEKVRAGMPTPSGYHPASSSMKKTAILAPKPTLSVEVFRERARALQEAGVEEIDILLARELPQKTNPFRAFSGSQGLGVPMEHPLALSLAFVDDASVSVNLDTMEVHIGATTFNTQSAQEIANTIMKHAPKLISLSVHQGTMAQAIEIFDLLFVFSQQALRISVTNPSSQAVPRPPAE